MLSKKIWVALRILVILLLLFGFAVLGVFGGFNYVLSQDSRFDTLKKGLAEGMEKGQQQEKVETVRRLQALGLSVDQIAQGAGLTAEEVKSLLS